jgi:outer membrane protein assembly factor BamB
MLRAIFKWSALALLLLIGVFLALKFFFGLRLERSGAGLRSPIASFKPSPEEHMKAIEKKSEEDRKALAAPPAAPAPAASAPSATASPPATAATAVPELSAPWPSFYGPRMDGTYIETPILTEWPSSGLQQLWRRPVGGGYASMTVAQDLVFTIEQRRDQETVAAYELKTGRERWTNAWKAFFQESMGGDGPRATPVYSEGRVYALGATGEFRCLDAASGRLLWRKNILEDAGTENISWGMAASPLIADSLAIVLPGKTVTAYDKTTGERKWVSLGDTAAYTAPMIATLAGVRQILAVTAGRAAGLNVSDGKLLWSFPWKTDYDVNSALPVIVDANRFILSAGYGHGASLIEVVSSGGVMSARELWHNNSLKAKFNNAVHHSGVVYGLDEGIMVAVDVNTGKRLWKGGRYGYGQLLLAGDHIIVLTETGDVVLVKANPQRLEELAKFEALSGKTWNVPAIAQGRLLVRNTTHMAAYQIGR